MPAPPSSHFPHPTEARFPFGQQRVNADRRMILIVSSMPRRNITGSPRNMATKHWATAGTWGFPILPSIFCFWVFLIARFSSHHLARSRVGQAQADSVPARVAKSKRGVFASSFPASNHLDRRTRTAERLLLSVHRSVRLSVPAVSRCAKSPRPKFKKKFVFVLGGIHTNDD